jgi:hypothetical protein
MSYMVDKSPVEDKLLNVGVRPWEPKEHRPVLTASRSAYKPYSTYVEWHSAQIGSIRMLTLANTKQRQEQVHSVDAQVRTPVEQSQQIASCCRRCPRYTKALGNLLCYVNIVRFGEHISNRVRRKPRDSALVYSPCSSPILTLSFNIFQNLKPCIAAR